MRTLLLIGVFVFFVVSDSGVLAQKSAKRLPIEVIIKHKIDSLETLKSLINRKLREIDGQINKLTEFKRKIAFHELSRSQSVFGIVMTDIHMRLTNGEMSDKIGANSRVLILDYVRERKSFKVKHNGQIGYLSDSWLKQTQEVMLYKSNKAASSPELRGQKAINTTTITVGIETTAFPVSN